MTPVKTILHPTDFSESAEAAFSVATVLARQHGARIIVLHVYPPPMTQGEAVDRRRDPSYEADLWHLLDRYSSPDPETRVEYKLVEGAAAEKIVSVAEEEDCDLIVMGTHGRTGVLKLLVGSVTDAVLRKATACPVLTVRIPTAGKKPSKVKEEKVAAV